MISQKLLQKQQSERSTCRVQVSVRSVQCQWCLIGLCNWKPYDNTHILILTCFCSKFPFPTFGESFGYIILHISNRKIIKCPLQYSPSVLGQRTLVTSDFRSTHVLDIQPVAQCYVLFTSCLHENQFAPTPEAEFLVIPGDA